jgi:hypothetical protein
MSSNEHQFRLPPLPPGAPLSGRLSYSLLKFLWFHSRLEGLMSFVCVWWGLWTIVFSDFWGDWPVTVVISLWSGGHPMLISWVLLVAGAIGYVAKMFKWNHIRSVCFLASFASWAFLSVLFIEVRPVFSPGVACYTAFCLATLIAYVNFKVEVAQEKGNVH